MLAAVTVTVAMRTVGLLLVRALMVVPVATAQQLTRSFRTTLLARDGCWARWRRSAGWCLGVRVLRRDVAPGPTIVLLSLAGFVVTWPVGVWLRRRQRLRAPFPAQAAPTARPRRHRGPRRTSTARTAATWRSQHGDHVDYVHDGHRHAPHGEHYDEH